MVTWGSTTIFGATSDSSNVHHNVAPRNGLSFTKTTPANSPSTLAMVSYPTSQLDTVAATSPRLTSSTSTNNQNYIPNSLVPFSQTSDSLTSSSFSHKVPVPQQAALQAHINATLHQEATRLQSILQNLYLSYSSYTPNSLNTCSTSSNPQLNTLCSFQHILYDEIAELVSSSISGEGENCFHVISQGIGSYSNPYACSFTTKPHHIDLETWSRAQYQNPDQEKYIPTILTGAESLHSRIVSQHARSKIYKKHLLSLTEAYKKMKEASHASQRAMERAGQINAELTRNLLTLIRKVELARCANLPLQPSEKQLIHRLIVVSRFLEKSHQLLDCVRADSEAYITKLSSLKIVSKFDGEHLKFRDNKLRQNILNILNRERKGINFIDKVLSDDKRDIDIIKGTDIYFLKSITTKTV